MENKVQPLVAIGVPVYNGDKFLAECLESILAQTYQNWECVIVNNCSTDNSAQIARTFEARDSRFKLVDCTDFVALVPNWNRLFVNSSNDAVYFKVVQADDWIYPESLSLMVNLLEQLPSAGFCASYRVDGAIVNCDGLNYYEGPLFDGKELLGRHLREEIDISGSVTTPLFRVSILKKLPTFPLIFNEEEYHIDTRILYEMMFLADVAFVFQVLSYTRWHDDAETMRLCVRFNTFLNGKEHRLFRFKDFYPGMDSLYLQHRNRYAYYLFKARVMGKKKLLEWHGRYLSRPFTTWEYLRAVFLMNGIMYRLLLPFRRQKKKSGVIKVNA